VQQVVRLTRVDFRLLSARFTEHDNSHVRMRNALLQAGAEDTVARLAALRAVERSFAIDLGSLCHRFLNRDEATTHPLERMVLSYVACWGGCPKEGETLLVLVDRVRQVRALIGEAGGIEGADA
jgi:hypothetical protein